MISFTFTLPVAATSTEVSSCLCIGSGRSEREEKHQTGTQDEKDGNERRRSKSGFCQRSNLADNCLYSTTAFSETQQKLKSYTGKIELSGSYSYKKIKHEIKEPPLKIKKRVFDSVQQQIMNE